ncbi:MAG: hypothetical protein NTU43_12210 [Bacteroidetes bacterium]|nr:hypothetical protein [Bacteroidota bacterium]
MKTITRLLLVICLYISTTSAQTIGIRIPDTTSTIGNIIDIPIYVDSTLTGKNVLSYQLQVSYYTVPISFIGIITTGTLSAGYSAPSYNLNKTTGILSISAAGSTALAGKGKLLYMRFQLNQSTNIGFNFSGVSTCYFNQGLPAMNFKSGILYINAPPTISAYFGSAVPLTVGDSVQVYVSGGTSPYTYQVITPSVASITANGMLKSIAGGKTKVRVQSANGIVDTTDSDIELRELKLIIPDTTILPLSSIVYPVRINSTNSSNILSGSFRVNFCTSCLLPDSILLGNTLLQNAFVYYQVYSGYMLISFAKSSYLSGAGNLLKIRFKVLNPSSSGLSVQNILFNQNTPANTLGGSIYFSSVPQLYISPTNGEFYTNQTQQFTASGGVPPYSFMVTDTSKGSISSNGFFVAKKGGMVKVKVTDSINTSTLTNNLQVYDALLSLPNIGSSKNTSFNYPVSISNLTGQRSIYSMQITITYTDNTLDSVEAFLTNTMASNWSITQNSTTNKITIAIAGTNPINTNGILFRLKGKVKNPVNIGANIYFYASNLLFNQGDFYAKSQDGYMNIVLGNLSLNLTAFLQGLYNGNGTMSASPFAADGVSPATIADTISVELHESTGNHNLVYSSRSTLGTNGVANIIFPSAVSGNSYYIVLKHRNSIETWSSVPVAFSSSGATYSFSNSASKAFGDNISDMSGGIFAIYTGDINQDGSVDFNDYPELDISSNNGDLGYLSNDLNGDASVDFNDYPILDINSSNGVLSITP